jgi:hypothetical protein
VSVARARELAEAWRAGALRPEEERELQALLLDGGVLVETCDKPPNACPDCDGEGGEFVDHCQCDAWSECPTCEGEGTVGAYDE